MPINCSTTTLTGQDGAIYMQPAGTQFCLYDFSDFPAGTLISVPANHDFRVGDPVTFTEEGSAQLDSALAAGTTYYVVEVVASPAPGIRVSATNGGTPITLLGDGGSGTANTPGAANHIEIDYAEFGAVAQVKEFSLEIQREELDTTTLPVGVGNGGGKYARFRTSQSGFASGRGNMQVLFSEDQSSLANRILDNVLLKSQAGAEVKLYVNQVVNSAGTAPDDTKSIFVQAPINILSMSLNVTPQDTTMANLSYSLSDQPTRLLGITL